MPRAGHVLLRALRIPLGVVGLFGLAHPPPSASADDGARGIFAAEDTLEIPADFKMTTIEVRADRLGIGEIVERCIARENEVRDRIDSHECTVISKATLSVGEPGAEVARQRVQETVERQFFRKPDERRTVVLRKEAYALESGERKEWDPEKDEMEVSVSYRSLDELPFYLEEHDAYDFAILARQIVGDRVIYEVRLTPKSDFEIAPAGTIWVDTSTFSILREEFDFGDRVPLPLFVRRIGPFIRERERVGDFWMWKRLLIRVELRGALFRWIDRDVPDVAEFIVIFRDHRVNGGWSDEAAAAAPADAPRETGE